MDKWYKEDDTKSKSLLITESGKGAPPKGEPKSMNEIILPQKEDSNADSALEGELIKLMWKSCHLMVNLNLMALQME